MKFKVLKPFRLLNDWLQPDAVVEVREDLVEGLLKEKFIGHVNDAPVKK